MLERYHQPGADALMTWRRKLDFLLEEEAKESDPSRRFQLGEEIAKARDRITELEQESATVVGGNRGRQRAAWPRPQFAEAELRQRSQELDRLYGEKRAHKIAGRTTSDIDEAIRRRKSELRRGPSLRPADRLLDGRFELLENLGRGGFGQVWKAWDDLLHDCVAVKVLFPHLVDEHSTRKRFFRGAKAMARLHHSHVVRVLQPQFIDEEDGWHFFTMEWVDGCDLEQAISSGLITSYEEKFRIIMQVGQALEHAHEMGLIHRDVKPSNILLDHRHHPSLTDFDLARIDSTDTPCTATHAMMGTLNFAAPELLSSPRRAGPQADVYALASTSIFVFRGEALPGDYYKDSAATIANLKISKDVAAVLRKATAHEPKDRYPEISRFVDHLMNPPKAFESNFEGARTVSGSGSGRYRHVTKSRKDSDGDITALCNPSGHWSPRSKSDAISDIENKIHTYYVLQGNGTRAEIQVVNDQAKGKYLRTRPDQTVDNNLDNLPNC